MVGPFVAAQGLEPVLDQIDDLDEAGRHADALALLERSLPDARSDAERAELHWRAARVHVGMGGDLLERGATEVELLALFEEGEAHADRAIAAAPDLHLGYYWKS